MFTVSEKVLISLVIYPRLPPSIEHRLHRDIEEPESTEQLEITLGQTTRPCSGCQRDFRHNAEVVFVSFHLGVAALVLPDAIPLLLPESRQVWSKSFSFIPLSTLHTR